MTTHAARGAHDRGTPKAPGMGHASVKISYMTDGAISTWTTELLHSAEAQAAAINTRSVLAEWSEDADERLREIVTALDRSDLLTVFAAEFDHYGSGFASFVEVKLTRRDDSLGVPQGPEVETQGFGLLLNRLAPIAALQTEAFEQTSNWGRSGSSSLPHRDALASLPVPGFPESSSIADVLQQYDYRIIAPTSLLEPITPGLLPLTNLTDKPWTTFDAWFYWYD